MTRDRVSIWYYIKSYRFNSILIRNFLLALLIIVFPISGVSLFIYYNMNDIIEDEISTININSLYRVKDVIDTVFQDMDRMATQISITDDVNVFLLSYKQHDDDRIYNSIYHTLSMFTLVYQYIDSIYIYSSNKDMVISDRDNDLLRNYRDLTWYDVYRQKEDNSPWVQSRKKFDKYPYIISLVRPAYLYRQEKLGAVIVNVDVEELGKLINRTRNNILDNIIIVDEAGTILYSNKRELISENVKDTELYTWIPWETDSYSGIREINEQKYIVSTTRSSYQPWKYISILPLEHYKERLERLQSFLFKIAFIGILVALLIALLISVKSFQPVRNIISVFEDPERWSKSKNIKEGKNLNEIKYIADNIIKTIYSNKQLEEELQTRLIMLNKAWTTALQAQINPHFLYNTMENIKWMAVEFTKSRNAVSEAIASLSELYRRCFDTEEQLVLIGEEIEYTHLYINIMKMRYKNKFTVDWEVDEEVLQYKIVKVCLQPLVENAIYHGIQPKREHGVIKISGKLEENLVVLEVTDNGVGLSESEVYRLNDTIQKEWIQENEHIGIYNVNQRIKLLMGHNYGLAIMSTYKSGTTVKIRIPQV